MKPCQTIAVVQVVFSGVFLQVPKEHLSAGMPRWDGEGRGLANETAAMPVMYGKRQQEGVLK